MQVWPWCVIAAFLLLGYCFLVDDFSVRYVLLNSNKNLAAIFKLTAIWGGHEGSLLLWLAELSGWSLVVWHVSRKHLNATERLHLVAWLSLIACVLLGLQLFSSNPFARILVISLAQGQDLNPLLQDPGMISHPPMLYAGYVGMAVVYAVVMSMISSRVRPQQLLALLRPIIRWAWLFLTIGITLGASWAYHQLGWGGWWFWDPVENASFMPWLVATSLIHSVVAARHDITMARWVIVGGILGFVLSILGTFWCVLVFWCRCTVLPKTQPEGQFCWCGWWCKLP